MARVVKNPEVRRAELLDVAFGLVQQVGFDGMSVEAVTTTATVAKGTFYHSFASKAELLYQLLERLGDGLTGHISNAVESTPGTARVRLQALVNAAAEYKTTHTGEYSWVTFLYRRENQLLRYRLYSVWAEATRPVLR
ncbi:MAG: TetR/AcrR family transcriptional regulator, partial [Propionicimonas sp.]